MEKWLEIDYSITGEILETCEYSLVRYADDFLIFAKNEVFANIAKSSIGYFLESQGLFLSPEKTNVRNCIDGFNFLGWSFKLTETNDNSNSLSILPSEKSIEKIKTTLELT